MKIKIVVFMYLNPQNDIFTPLITIILYFCIQAGDIQPDGTLGATTRVQMFVAEAGKQTPIRNLAPPAEFAGQ